MANIDTSIIDSIDWTGLQHAYGNASDAPEHLRNLFNSEEEFPLSEAVYGFLHSSACHQYTTYSCTPYVVRCVLYLLSKKEVGCGLMHGVVGFVDACSVSARCQPELAREILAGADLYKQFAGHRDARVAERAKALVEFCEVANQ